jgi:alpha-galactosidase
VTLRTWRLDTPSQTLALAARGDGLPEAFHWGAPLPPDTDLATLARAAEIDFTGGQLDAVPPLSLCPDVATGFSGQPGLALRDASGMPLAPRFRPAGDETTATTLTLRYVDPARGLRLAFHLATDGDLLILRTTLASDVPIRLDWLAAPVLPAPQDALDMIDVAGRWCGEFQPVRTPWSPGARLRDNRTGRSGHEHFPGLYLPGRGAANTHGEARALHYAWSGGHRMIAEELPDGRRQIQFGHAPGAETRPGTRFETAPLLAAHSTDGLNGCAIAFQRHVREAVPWPDPARPRPVHYNCWESVYFDHDLQTLRDIATRAAALGAERFVLDDGWFERRDHDTSSLGDWNVDPRKYPDGLAPLIDHVHAQGMTFGLWVEPEMVSPDSDLTRAHPDWVLGPPDQPLGRNQLALDMSRDDVRDHLQAALAALLRVHPIDYLKWDHNRTLPGPDADQTRGTYALLDRLRADFPALEIESCASGGGRLDAGILTRTHRVWLSDSNDALERLRIHHDAALFLPAVVTGAHVGPRRCHTTGRVLDMHLRAWTAAQRHMGFEMDPRELTGEEAATLTRVTAWWKANRDWLMRADIHRLDSPDPAVLAEQQMAEDGGRFVLFAARLATSAQIAPRPLRLTALDPAATYRVELLDRDAIPALSRASLPIKDGPLDLPGAWLMSQGLTLPWSHPASIQVVEGRRL